MMTGSQGQAASNVQLVGPFMLFEAGPWPLVYLPHYFLRCCSYDRLCELLPVNPRLNASVQFYAKDRESQAELARKIMDARNLVQYIQECSVPFIYTCSQFDSSTKTFVPLESVTIRNNKLKLMSTDHKKSVIKLNAESRITTEKGDQLCFSVWTPECTTFKMENLDAVLCSILALDVPLMKMRKESTENKSEGLTCISRDFPIEIVRMESVTKPIFKNSLRLPLSATYKTSSLDFTVTPSVPEVAAAKLAIVDTSGDVGRTILIRNERSSQGLRPTVKDKVEPEIDIPYKDIFNVRCVDISEIDFPVSDGDEQFSFASESERIYFGMNGNLLMDKYFQPPDIDGNVEEDMNRIGLKFEQMCVVPFGQDIVESLDGLIQKLPSENVDMTSKSFENLVLNISSILMDGADLRKVGRDFEIIAMTMPHSIASVPNSTRNAFDFVATLTARLIEAHKIRGFVNAILATDAVRDHLYTENSLMRIPQFIAHLSSSLSQLDKHEFTGRLPPLPVTCVPIRFSHFQISFLISKDVDMILQLACSRDPCSYEAQICALLEHLQEFLRDGFALKKASLWGLFRFVSNLDIFDQSLDVFKKTITETESSARYHWLMVPACLLQGLRRGICHMWLLFLARASQDHGGHESGAPINNHGALTIVAEALKSLSATPVNMEPNSLYYHAHMFSCL